MKTFLHKSHFLSIVFLIANLFFACASYGQATVSTDLLDYPPGATAIITLSGFQPLDSIVLLVEHVGEEPMGTDPQFHQPWIVVADSTGSAQTSWYVPTVEEGDALGATFLLTADGMTSLLHAEATFTDANAINGDGTMTVSSTSVCSGSVGNSFTFTFSAGPGKAYSSGSQATLVIPAAWSAPQNTTTSNPGFVSVSPKNGDAASISTISGTGPWTIIINMSGGNNNGFTLTYAGGGSKVTAPTVAVNTPFTFTTQTKSGSGGALTNIGSQPTVTVNAIPQGSLSGNTVCFG
ncbi:MAG: hypothetical protein PSX42_05905, partial [bacterium]|nr:hypothetical protein [bacterium]